MEVAGEAVTVEPGDEVLIPEGALYSLRNVHHATSVWLYGYDGGARRERRPLKTKAPRGDPRG